MKDLKNEDNQETYKQERLHLRVIDDTIDVLYRPNHKYLIFLKNDKNGRDKVIELATMSREEFKDFLKTVSCLPRLSKDMMLSIKESKEEEWYQGAWKIQTTKLLNELGVENPIEEPIYTSELFDN